MFVVQFDKHGLSATPYGATQRTEMLEFIPKDARRVLDVGCHLGTFGNAIKIKYGAEVWGIEPNPATAAVAATLLDKVITNIFTADVALPDNYFDTIVFNDVLEHMPDPWAALKLAAAKLIPGGHIVASIPNLRYIDNLLHILRDKDFKYEPTGIRDTTHLRFYTRKSVPRLFDESGLTILRIVGINEAWWTPSLVRRLAFRIFPTYLDDTRFVQFAVVAQSPAAAANTA